MAEATSMGKDLFNALVILFVLSVWAIAEVLLRCPNRGNPDCEEAEEFKQRVVKQVAELTRLRDAVVEAALADRAAENAFTGDDNKDIDKMIAARNAYRESVNALIKFESENS